MRKGRKFAAAVAAALFVSAVPMSAFGAVIKYSPEKTSTVSSSKESKEKDESLLKAVETVKALIETGKLTKDEIEKLGPGYAAALKEYSEQFADNLGVGLQEALEEETNSDFNGPSVTKVTLGEAYHEEYKTYELSMADKYFLYSNVGNGGMTHEPVMIDIPANVSYTMEKDGLPYEYVSQQYIYEKGTYVMTLMGVENKNAPLSEQKEYQATFRFRIQDPPPVEESEAVENLTSGTIAGTIFGNTEIPIIGIPETQPVVKEEPETQPVEETTAPEEEPESEPAIVPENTVRMEREQDFELATGNYIVTLENGKKLTTNVPEGYIGSGSVYLNVAEGDVITTTLYKNDKPVDFVNDSSVTEFGRYRVDVDGCSYFFTLAYEVGQMEYYPAPVGMEFTEVSLDGEEVSLKSDQYVEMESDGTYGITMKGDHGERYEVTLLKDTVAPEMIVTTNKSTASIQYLSKDIASLELVRNGEIVSGFNSNSIAEPGNYTLTITDKAGNSSSASFSLKYQVNMYGILAAVLVILSIAGVGAFVVYTKKNTKVR